MKKTPWFPCSIKPVHNGWYEVSLQGFHYKRAQFSGGKWRRLGGMEWNTAINSFRPGYDIGDKWRGIAK